MGISGWLGDGDGDVRRERLTCALLIALRVAVCALVIVDVPAFRSAAAGRFHEIAATPGIPYRDFAVEYPIGELGIATLVGLGSLGAARVILALLALGADLTAFTSVWFGWGLTAARRYLWLGTPLLVFIYRRADLVAVALAVLGLALAERRGRERSGGAVLGLAGLIKLWPCALVPVVLIGRRVRAAVFFGAVFVGGVAGWFALGGASGITQVTSFRGATGWELESSVGTVVWAATGDYRFEAGANRTGLVPGWSRVVLLVLLVASVTVVWLQARRLWEQRRMDPAGVPSLVVLSIVLVLSPLLSPQYVAWLVPWGAIGAREGRRWWWMALTPCLLTGITVASWYLGLTGGHAWRSQALLIVRNLSLLAIPVMWFLARGRGGESSAQPCASGQLATSATANPS